MSNPSIETPPEKVFERYESGKDRRYKLFFAVNGGAFAIVSLWVKLPSETAELTACTPLFGGLSAWHVGVGMALFCALMAVDIWKFGSKFADLKAPPRGEKPEYFGPVGRVVLLAITGLTALAWLLATDTLSMLTA